MGSSTVAFFGRIYMMIKNKGDLRKLWKLEKDLTRKNKNAFSHFPEEHMLQ